eukprot:Nitzschia sp. Nitz4//scaffold13_size275219//141696//143036//NITZ4_000877-RA/size275219-processed-gene-0.157-mRNA-1//-1//CDS//3329536023//1895//frame0
MDHPSIHQVLDNYDILLIIFSFLSVLDIRRASCVCHFWKEIIQRRGFNKELLVVTVAGSNEIALVSASGHIIQRFPASAGNRNKKRKRLTTSRHNRLTYCWPTCLETGPQGQLFVSQYKVPGVLEFTRCRNGYEYHRTLASGPSFTFPEGIVSAHNSIYVVSAENAHVLRLSTAGKILERASASIHTDLESEWGLGLHVARLWTLWGMCISPDERSLYIAGHECDDGDYRDPTREDTGYILRLNLAEDGSFAKRIDGRPRGFYVHMPPPRMVEMTEEGRTVIHVYNALRLNRPSNPTFCRHGILHVSTFLGTEHGRRRRIQKLAPVDPRWKNLWPLDLGWLDVNSPDGPIDPWEIAHSKTTDEIFVTTFTQSPSTSPSLVKLETCGCDSHWITSRQNLHSSSPTTMLEMDMDPEWGTPESVVCGEVSTIIGKGVFDQTNFVLNLGK